jgi:hemolysin type calcium-binding protein
MKGLKGIRAVLSGAAVCVVLFAIPAAAPAHVNSRIQNGRLIAHSDGAADIIKVSCGEDLRVKVNGLDPNQGPALCSAIRRVRVAGFGGPDTINLTRVGPRNGFTNKGLRTVYAVSAYGGGSSDRISGSRLSDLLAGGAGHDVLRGRDGADLLRGGASSDRLLGGRGRDILIGGHGDDFLLGGAERDIVDN